MSDYYDDEWYDERWRSLPHEIREKAVKFLTVVISDDDMEKIRAKHAEYGQHMWIHHLIDTDPNERMKMNALLPPDAPEDHKWPATMSAHHGFGTAIRNELRAMVCKDEELPEAPYEEWPHEGEGPRNWDDYYVQAIEAAVGLREV